MQNAGSGGPGASFGGLDCGRYVLHIQLPDL